MIKKYSSSSAIAERQWCNNTPGTKLKDGNEWVFYIGRTDKYPATKKDTNDRNKIADVRDSLYRKFAEYLSNN